ncbi:SAM-dependent methyltransferase [Gilvimarinus polysaccharolyticus]|uniref:SAM-dependent methyltransferase n=1 Tax=Gilvimarinus polysaccharolyticus TaxID=863921 RepID=UPI000673BC91|nr:class I SAM-dependent methyltransferase [Gilvimarinus polysaccharolyticus]
MWDERYDEEGFAYGAAPNDFLRSECVRIPSAGKVLCLAEGEGRNAVFLAQQGYAVTAVDQSAVGLKKAQRFAAQCGVEITTQVADLAHYDFGCEQWDGIVSISAHVPALLRKRLHAEVVQALKPGGVFILEAYTAHQLDMPGVGGPPAAQQDLFMSLAELRVELDGLDMLVGAEVERYISEGKYHLGESAVVQVIAAKTV